MWIPTRDELAWLDGVTILDAENRAIRYFIALAFAAELIDHRQFAGPGYRHQMPFLLVFHSLYVVHPDRTGRFNLDAVNSSGAGRCAADMERAHGQLSTGFADRLRGDDANGLALIDQVPPTEVAPVALGAYTVAHLTGDGRAHQQLIDGGGFKQFDRRLVQ